MLPPLSSTAFDASLGRRANRSAATPSSAANRTAAIEGSLLLQAVGAPLARILTCNWFNEYARFSERDQIAISYVLLRMGLTGEGGQPAAPLALLPRSLHYLAPAAERERDLVKKLGHRAGSRKAPQRAKPREEPEAS